MHIKYDAKNLTEFPKISNQSQILQIKKVKAFNFLISIIIPTGIKKIESLKTEKTLNNFNREQIEMIPSIMLQ